MESAAAGAQATLSELGEFRNGVNFGKGLKGKGLGLINVKDIFRDSPKVDFSSLDLVDLAGLRGVERYFVEEGDLFFVRSSVKREGIGFVAHSDRRHHGALHCGFVIRFRPDKKRVDYRFLTYALRSPEARDKIRNLSGGAAITNVSQEALGTLPVHIPPLRIQQRIASILSAYDDLIENNQRRIKILETMARALYREWFVHFRFPGHENHPRVASPLGEIPEGWERKTVSDSFDITGGGTPSRKEPAYWAGGTVQWFSPSDLTGASTMFMDDSGDHITDRGLAGSSARLFPARSVMLTSRATIGVVAINTHEACTNQGFITCIPNERVPLNFLFQWIRENVPTFQRMASGATFKEISRGVFKTIEVILPPVDLVRRFEDIVSPLSEQILVLQRQVQNLRRTRDLLLPRLLSGQITFSDLEANPFDEARTSDEAPTAQAPARAARAISPAPKPAIAPEPTPAIDDTERADVLCTIRQVFNDGGARHRDSAIRDIAHALGYQRTGSHIREVVSGDLATAVRRGIVTNDGGVYRLGYRSYAECTRESLKSDFESAIGRAWIERDDAIRAFARWGGFGRVGPVIEETARSLINGLIREGRLETDGRDRIRRV